MRPVTLFSVAQDIPSAEQRNALGLSGYDGRRATAKCPFIEAPIGQRRGCAVIHVALRAFVVLTTWSEVPSVNSKTTYSLSPFEPSGAWVEWTLAIVFPVAAANRS